jgi:hypothetical protein
MVACDHFKKLLFARQQRLGTLPVFDVSSHCVPADNAVRFIAVRKPATLKPSIGAIVPSKAGFEPVRLTGLGRSRKDLMGVGAVLGVDGIVGPPVLQLLQRLAEVGRDRTVDELQLAGRSHEQYDTGDVVDDQARGSLAVWQGILREPALLLHYALLHIACPLRSLRATAGLRRFDRCPIPELQPQPSNNAHSLD